MDYFKINCEQFSTSNKIPTFDNIAADEYGRAEG